MVEERLLGADAFPSGVFDREALSRLVRRAPQRAARPPPGPVEPLGAPALGRRPPATAGAGVVSRITLVVNRHDSPSETFAVPRRPPRRRRPPGDAARAPGGWASGRSDRRGPHHPGVPPLRARSAPALLARLAAGSQPGLALAARRARARHGATPRALRAALAAGPILGTDPDAVHLGFSGIGVAIRDALDLLGDVPLVVSCRGTDELVRPLLDPDRAAALGDLVARVDRVHAVADAVAEAVVALGADPAAVRVIRPAIDLARWTPPADAAPPRSGPAQVVAVGRLEAAKGLDDLLAAIATLHDDGLDLALDVVGRGPHLDALRLRAARSGVAEQVTFHGAQPPEEVRRIVRTADLFVSASLSEGISNGVLEAMATGVPVVSTEVGGMAEVITDGVDGWLVPAGRPVHLAAAIAGALDDPVRRAAVGAAGRRRVEDGFGLERQGAEWLALYRDLLVGSEGEASRNLRRPRGGG